LEDGNLKGEMLLVYYSTLLELLENFDFEKKGNQFSYNSVPGRTFEAIVEFARVGAGPVQFTLSYYSRMDANDSIDEHLSVTGMGRCAKSRRFASSTVARTEASLAYRIKQKVIDLARAKTEITAKSLEQKELDDFQKEMRDLLADCK